MPMIPRRRFLRAGALASAALVLPKALQGWGGTEGKDRILVLIELSGGNDGLNTAVPYRQEAYYKARPQLAIPRRHLLPLNDAVGLHPALRGLQGLYDQGALALLHGVGYPKPERSHFRARALWQTAGPSGQILPAGWIGRYLDARYPGTGTTTGALEVAETLSLSLKGIRTRGMTMPPAAGRHEARYPDSALGQRLKAVAAHIFSGADTRVYQVSLDGFDTHVNQAARHPLLLEDLGDSIQAFSADLSARHRFKQVLVVTFSEFGRRLAQNTQGGTDHGTSNCMFFISGGLKKPGVLNTPDLPPLDPETGDLVCRVDFRRVYATLLRQWLQADDRKILQASHHRLSFL